MWYKGPNPTVDIVLFRTHPIEGEQVLLIRRGIKSSAEAGKWALPGGFQDTNAPKGGPWKAGKETPVAAAVRELMEETGVAVNEHQLVFVGVFEGDHRDPRDTREAWSKSTAWTLNLGKEGMNVEAQGLDDADAGQWVNVSKLKEVELAFDHRKIITKALGVVKLLSEPVVIMD